MARPRSPYSSPFRSASAYRVLLIIFAGLFTNNLPADNPNSVRGNFGGDRVTITAHQLKIITLNVAHGRKGRLNQIFLFADTIKKNLREVANHLRLLSPHLVSLQEADGSSLWSGLFDHTGYLAQHGDFPYYASAGHSSTPFFQFGTAFLSSVPLQEVRSISFSPSPPTLRKGFLMVTVPWNPGGRLSNPVNVSLVSVHLDFSRRKVREKQTRELIGFLAAAPRPLILSGDLNSDWTGDDSTVRDIAHSLDLHTHEPNSTALGTYPSTGKRLDWILISPDLEFTKYALIPEVLSDHLAVSASVRLR